MKKLICTPIFVMLLYSAIAQSKTFTGYITQVICVDFCDILVGPTLDSETDKTTVMRMLYEKDGVTMKINPEARTYFKQNENYFEVKPEYKDKKFKFTCTEKLEEFTIDKIELEVEAAAINSGQAVKSTIGFETMKGYFIGSGNLNGPVLTETGIANKTYTKSDYLILSKNNYKAKNGKDSSAVSTYLTGKFVDGLPQGIIQQYSYEKLVYEYHFNDKTEIIKEIQYDGNGNISKLVEFSAKAYMKMERYENNVLREKEVRTGQAIKKEVWFSDGTRESEINLIVETDAKETSPYFKGWPSTDKNGVHKKWNSKGQIIKNYTYLNDEETGKCSEYFENNGKLKKFHTYTNGVKNGKYAIYEDAVGYGPKNSEGTPTLQEGTYVDGKRTTYKVYKKDGTFQTLTD